MGREQGGRFSRWMGHPTVSLLVLLVLPHSFEACGTGKSFVGEGTLVVWLWTVLSVYILVGLGGVVYMC